MITKKHFNKIAELIERNIPQGKFIIADDLVKDLADFFESDNPNFHRGKFIHACHNPKNKKSAIKLVFNTFEPSKKLVKTLIEDFVKMEGLKEIDSETAKEGDYYD